MIIIKGYKAIQPKTNIKIVFDKIEGLKLSKQADIKITVK
jgi:hypothetical protein